MIKRAGIISNSTFIKIYTVSFGLQPVIDPKFDNLYFSHNETLSVIGKALVDVLNRSRTLQKNDPEYRLLCWRALKDTKYKDDLDKELRAFKYKNKTFLYRDMQYCLIDLQSEKIIFSPFKHEKLESWEGLDEVFDLVIESSCSPEVIGAAIKYSIASCKGKGSDSVAKKLFPDGIPKTFDSYLASLNLKL